MIRNRRGCVRVAYSRRSRTTVTGSVIGCASAYACLSVIPTRRPTPVPVSGSRRLPGRDGELLPLPAGDRGGALVVGVLLRELLRP